VDIPLSDDLESLAGADVIVNFGADLPRAQPMAWLRVVEALGKGASLIVVGSGHHTATREASLFLRTRPGEETVFAAALAAELGRRGVRAGKTAGCEDFLKAAAAWASEDAMERAGLSPGEVSSAADLVAAAKAPLVLFDGNVGRGPRGELNLASLWNLALLTGSRFLPLGSGSNDRGVSELERALVPGRGRMSAAALRKGLRDKDIEVLVLAGVPFDFGEDRPEFLVSLDTHWNPLAEAADVVFPAAAFAETDVTAINTEGRVQFSKAVIPSPGTGRADRETIAALAGKMGASGFDFTDSRAALDEISRVAPSLGDLGGKKPGRVASAPKASARPSKFIPLDLPAGASGGDPEYPFLLSVRASGDVYRNFDTARNIRGLGRLRTPGLIFLNPGDMEEIGVERDGTVEILSAEVRLTGTARPSRTLPRGAAETTLSGLEPGAGELLGGGLVPVNIRRKS
jgi:anaerobic selenocysteine-containing dehydrogenase